MAIRIRRNFYSEFRHMKQAGCGLRLPWLAYAALMGHHDILSTDPVIDDMDKNAN